MRKLSKAYGFLWALKDVDLDIAPGQCVALFGPNGAGKTTLLRLLSALTLPTAGEIEIEGRKLEDSYPFRSQIAYLSPGHHLYDNLTAKENLRFFTSLYARKKSEGEIEERLGQVGLSGWADHFVSSLSSGMKCRLSLAKWMLLEPQLLLLDEPYGVLDGGGVDLLENYIAALCRQNGAVLMATHHVHRAQALCSRALVLNRGKLIFDEPRREPWEGLYRVMGEFLPKGEKWSS